MQFAQLHRGDFLKIDLFSDRNSIPEMALSWLEKTLDGILLRELDGAIIQRNVRTTGDYALNIPPTLALYSSRFSHYFSLRGQNVFNKIGLFRQNAQKERGKFRINRLYARQSREGMLLPWNELERTALKLIVSSLIRCFLKRDPYVQARMYDCLFYLPVIRNKQT